MNNNFVNQKDTTADVVPVVALFPTESHFPCFLPTTPEGSTYKMAYASNNPTWTPGQLCLERFNEFSLYFKLMSTNLSAFV